MLSAKGTLQPMTSSVAAFEVRDRFLFTPSPSQGCDLIAHRFQRQTAKLNAVAVAAEFLPLETTFALRESVIAKADADNVEAFYSLLRQFHRTLQPRRYPVARHFIHMVDRVNLVTERMV